MKVIKDFSTKDGKCRLDGTECIPGETDCSFTQCLTKLLWGLRTEGFQEHAIEALEEFLEN